MRSNPTLSRAFSSLSQKSITDAFDAQSAIEQSREYEDSILSDAVSKKRPDTAFLDKASNYENSLDSGLAEDDKSEFSKRSANSKTSFVSRRAKSARPFKSSNPTSSESTDLISDKQKINVLNDAIFGQELKEIENVYDLKVKRREAVISAQKFNREVMMQKINVKKGPKSMVKSYLFQNRPISADIRMKHNEQYAKSLNGQIERRLQNDLENYERKLNSERHMRTDTFQKLEHQRHQEFQNFKQQRQDYKKYLDHQVTIPVFRYPKVENNNQIFGDSLSQTSHKIKRMRKNANSVSNFNYQRFYKEQQEKQKNKKFENQRNFELNQKIQNEYKRDCSKEWQNELRTRSNDNKIRAAQIQHFNDRAESEMKYMRMPSKRTITCKMSDLERKPAGKVKCFLREDFHNFNRVNFMD